MDPSLSQAPVSSVYPDLIRFTNTPHEYGVSPDDLRVIHLNHQAKWLNIVDKLNNLILITWQNDDFSQKDAETLFECLNKKIWLRSHFVDSKPFLAVNLLALETFEIQPWSVGNRPEGCQVILHLSHQVSYSRICLRSEIEQLIKDLARFRANPAPSLSRANGPPRVQEIKFSPNTTWKVKKATSELVLREVAAPKNPAPPPAAPQQEIQNPCDDYSAAVSNLWLAFIVEMTAVKEEKFLAALKKAETLEGREQRINYIKAFKAKLEDAWPRITPHTPPEDKEGWAGQCARLQWNVSMSWRVYEAESNLDAKEKLLEAIKTATKHQESIGMVSPYSDEAVSLRLTLYFACKDLAKHNQVPAAPQSAIPNKGNGAPLADSEPPKRVAPEPAAAASKKQKGSEKGLTE